VAACAVCARQPWKKQVGHALTLTARPERAASACATAARTTLCAAATAAATGLGSRAQEGMGRPAGTVRQRKYGPTGRPQTYCMRTPPTRYCRLGGWPWPRPTGHFPQLWRCLRAPAGRSPDRFTPGFGRARARGRSGSGGRWRWWTDRRRTNDRSCCC
jgi:hypothetical protein